MAATAAVTISRLGGLAAFWGRAGEDNYGHKMQEQLVAEAVDISCFRLFEKARSPIASVVVDESGERQISTYRGSGIPEGSEWLPLDAVSNARAVLADMRWMERAIALFETARKYGVPTVLDADIAEMGEYSRILGLTDYALFSEAGLAACAPGVEFADALNSVCRLGCRVAGVTKGSQGDDWLDADGVHHTPAFKVDVVDTTGARDVFHGAFTLGIRWEYATREAMDFASAAAALKCQARGGRKGIPSVNKLTEFMKNQQYYREKTSQH